MERDCVTWLTQQDQMVVLNDVEPHKQHNCNNIQTSFFNSEEISQIFITYSETDFEAEVPVLVERIMYLRDRGLG